MGTRNGYTLNPDPTTPQPSAGGVKNVAPLAMEPASLLLGQAGPFR